MGVRSKINCQVGSRLARLEFYLSGQLPSVKIFA